MGHQWIHNIPQNPLFVLYIINKETMFWETHIQTKLLAAYGILKQYYQISRWDRQPHTNMVGSLDNVMFWGMKYLIKSKVGGATKWFGICGVDVNSSSMDEGLQVKTNALQIDGRFTSTWSYYIVYGS